MISGEEIAGLTALGTLIGAVLTAAFRPRRVRAQPPAPWSGATGVPPAPTPIPPALPDESASPSGPPVAPQPAPSPGREPYKPMIFAAPRDQMIEFLRVVFEEHDAVKLPAFEWVSFYREWATARRMALMPDREFLTLLGKVEGAKKSRDRVKDRCGRVIHNDNGTPLRVTYYALFRPEVIEAAKAKRSRRADAGSERQSVAA